MMGEGLSLDQSPPLHISFRFFYAAIIFLLLFSAFFMLNSPTLINNRWLGSSVGIIHLFTVGFLSQVMMGAWFQMMPVLLGIKHQASTLKISIIHFTLVSGLLCFFAGFYTNELLYIKGATFLLVLSFGLFFILIANSLRKNKSTKTNLIFLSFTFSLLSFSITVFLAILLLLIRCEIGPNSWRESLVLLHMTHAIGGWVFILVFGVSTKVLPMFYVCSEPNKYVQRLFLTLQVLGLYSTSILIVLRKLFSPTNEYYLLGWFVLFLNMGLFAGLTFYNLTRSKKKLKDSTVLFWKTGLVAVGLFCLLSILEIIFRNRIIEINELAIFQVPINHFLLALFLIGGLGSLIFAMLYKIVPFLIWFQLFSKNTENVPHMRKIMSESKISLHFKVQLLVILLLVLSFLFRQISFFYLATLLFVSGLLTLYNFASSLRMYLSKKNPGS